MTSAFRRRTAILALLIMGAAMAGCQPQASTDNTYTIAFLRAVSGSTTVENSFLRTLRTLGYIPGQNLEILARSGDEVYPDHETSLRAIQDWQDRGVELIVALSTVSARAAKEASPPVETVFLVNDPMTAGLVENENAPEGSLTGVTFRVPADRTLYLARQAIPGLTRIGLAYPPDDPAALAHRDHVLTSAEQLGMEVVLGTFADDDDIAPAVSGLSEDGAEALLLSISPTAAGLYGSFERVASDEGLPVIANTSLSPRAVVSLFPDGEELGRQLGRQAGRLLSGTDPVSVPVEDPRGFFLHLNAATAADLGIELPDELMRQADEVTLP